MYMYTKNGLCALSLCVHCLWIRVRVRASQRVSLCAMSTASKVQRSAQLPSSRLEDKVRRSSWTRYSQPASQPTAYLLQYSQLQTQYSDCYKHTVGCLFCPRAHLRRKARQDKRAGRRVRVDVLYWEKARGEKRERDLGGTKNTR